MAVLAAVITSGIALTSAANAGPPQVGPPHVAAATVDPDFQAAADSAGTVHGFVDSAQSGYGSRLTYFRTSPTGTASALSPYTGQVVAVAWDGVDGTYVVYFHGNSLYLAVHHDRTASFSAPKVLSASYNYGGVALVASAGKWWVVWGELEGQHQVLFERHTLHGSGDRTHAVSTPATSSDYEPSLTYHDGTASLAWVRTPSTNAWPAVLKFGTGTGGLFSQTTLASGADAHSPDVSVSAGRTYVTWEDDNYIHEQDRAAGAWVSHTFTTRGIGPSVAVVAGHPYLAWTTYGTQILLAERTGSAWAGDPVTGAGAYGGTVLAGPHGPIVVYAISTGVRVRFS
jgi:hypothetical protein